MDHRSTLIRNVDIPATLPPMETLTKLTGSVLLKDVTVTEEGLRIEGDLLWRGYFESGGEDCLWEGAEFFSELLPDRGLVRDQETTVDPSILSLKGEPISEDVYRLTYEIRWHKSSKQIEPENHTFSEETALSADDEKEEDAEKEKHFNENNSEQVKTKAQTKTETREEKDINSIDESWRETLKKLNEPARGNKQTEEAAAAEEKEEVTVKCCPYSKFCLRYYRTREGDDLEEIAAKFSASVAKLKEFNHLENDVPQKGKMLRIP